MKKLIFVLCLAALATLGVLAPFDLYDFANSVVFAQGGQPAQSGSPAAAAGNQDPWASGTFNDLKLRAVGPAMMSGRVNVVAVDPEDQHTWCIGVASGGVWKTPTPASPSRRYCRTKGRTRSERSGSIASIPARSGSARVKPATSAA